MQGEFNSRTAHYEQISWHVPLCRIVTEARTSGQQRQQTREQVTLLPPGLGQRQPKTHTTPGRCSGLCSPVLCLAHFHFTGEKYSQNLLLFLVTAFNCKKIPALTFAEICPLLSFPNPGYFQGAQDLTPEQRPGSLEHLCSPPDS